MGTKLALSRPCEEALVHYLLAEIENPIPQPPQELGRLRIQEVQVSL